MKEFHMFKIHSHTWHFRAFLTMAVLGGILVIPGFSFASDLTEHLPQKGSAGAVQEQGDTQLSAGHRYIEGIVDAVNENTVRVDTEKSGGTAPRYLNLNRFKGDNDIKVGDTLQIEVNAQNKVVKYQKNALDSTR
jgi:hypothetical protein